ncbi:hypothetical protein ACVWWR_008922 [Bradyrhizobium sp. LM3.2]
MVSVSDLIDLKPRAVVISPGPCTPIEAGVSTAVVRELSGRVPILGICLGHQCIGSVFGGRVARARCPMHGRSSYVTHDGRGLFRELPSPLCVGRYHSLVIELDESCAPNLTVRARSDEGETRSWPSHIAIKQLLVCSSTRNRYLPKTGTWCLKTSWDSQRLIARSRIRQQREVVGWKWGCYLAKPTITRRRRPGRPAARKGGCRAAENRVPFVSAGRWGSLRDSWGWPSCFLQRCVKQFLTAARPTV